MWKKKATWQAITIKTDTRLFAYFCLNNLHKQAQLEELFLLEHD